MTTQNETIPYDGGPAFPTLHSTMVNREIKLVEGTHGMSLRDWFASMALIGNLASETEEWSVDCDEAASMAYAYADRMIKERQKCRKL